MVKNTTKKLWKQTKTITNKAESTIFVFLENQTILVWVLCKGLQLPAKKNKIENQLFINTSSEASPRY